MWHHCRVYTVLVQIQVNIVSYCPPQTSVTWMDRGMDAGAIQAGLSTQQSLESLNEKHPVCWEVGRMKCLVDVRHNNSLQPW